MRIIWREMNIKHIGRRWRGIELKVQFDSEYKTYFATCYLNSSNKHISFVKMRLVSRFRSANTRTENMSRSVAGNWSSAGNWSWQTMYSELAAANRMSKICWKFVGYRASASAHHSKIFSALSVAWINSIFSQSPPQNYEMKWIRPQSKINWPNCRKL